MVALMTSVAPLGDHYDAWFCDIWGVMHNGVSAFEGAVAACRRFRAEGGHVVLLTNAPRPAASVAAQLTSFGVPEDCYDGIVSSGDVAQHLISGFKDKAIHHIGPARDYPIVEMAKITPRPFAEAEVILLTGLIDDDNEAPDDYREMFVEGVQRKLPMICANPDLMVERGDRLIYCAGALAKLYEELGGEVLYAGKPYAPVYELAMARLSEITGTGTPRARVLCIGDGLKTDIPGALQAGFDALFVASALHVNGVLDEAALLPLFADLPGLPIGAIDALDW